MEKKYTTEKDSKTKFLRIIALKDFSDVKKGDKGGLIQYESNLSQEGDCWVYREAWVIENARVFGNAKVFGDARVYENARISENAKISDNAWVCGDARVGGNAKVSGGARVFGNAQVQEFAEVFGDATVYGKAKVYEKAKICGFVQVHGETQISGDVKLMSTGISHIHNSIEIKNSSDLVILAQGHHIFPSNIEDIVDDVFMTTTVGNYLDNIKTIRQLYGEKI